VAKWWRRKIKGIVGLGAMGGALGAFVGGAWYASSASRGLLSSEGLRVPCFPWCSTWP
jgi:hypothetical protein